MNKKSMKTRGGAFFAIVLLFGASQIRVTGQEHDAAGGTSGGPVFNMEGTWQTVVTQRNCQTGDVIRVFKGLSTYNEGGTMMESAASSSPLLRSTSHGVWQRESRTTFTASFVFLRFNPDGTFAGTQRTTITNVLTGRRGDTYDSTASIQVFDANDNLLGSGCATAAGTRLQLN